MPHKYTGRRVIDILQLEKGSVRTAPLPTGALPWAELEQLTWEQVEEGAARNAPGFRTVRKLLTDQRFDR